MRRVFVATTPLPTDGVNTPIGVYKVVILCPSVFQPTEPPPFGGRHLRLF